jgi:protein TonB
MNYVWIYKYIIALLVGLGNTALFAQSDFLVPRKNDEGEFGYVNQFGKKKIDYEYKYAGPFYKNRAVVLKRDSFYYLNTGGEIVSPGYELAYPFLSALTVVSRNGRFAFVDTSFKVIRNKWFQQAYLFKRKYAIAKGKKYKFVMTLERRLMRVSSGYKIPSRGKIRDVAEEMPYFPGGKEMMTAWLKKNLSLNDYTGLVYVSFLVDKDGSLHNLTISGQTDEQMKLKIKKAFHDMPPWVPGRQNGEVSRVRMNIPLFGKEINN